mmetsp:Transcript_24310/g.36034  ORF Transcript_24310/g.36034 Transcript_24310/m.36034 type:complete len:122 (+) Transcript_24310:2-367(+)
MSRSMKEVTESFNRGMKSPNNMQKCERTAEELKVLAEQRAKQQKEDGIESVLEPSPQPLSDAELQAIEEEREALTRELEAQQWNQRSSVQKLKEQRSRAASELEALREKRKKEGQQAKSET